MKDNPITWNFKKDAWEVLDCEGNTVAQMTLNGAKHDPHAFVACISKILGFEEPKTVILISTPQTGEEDC